MSKHVTRRSFIQGTALLLAAPAIIRVADIMPVKAWDSRQIVYEGYFPVADRFVIPDIASAHYYLGSQYDYDVETTVFDDVHNKVTIYAGPQRSSQDVREYLAIAKVDAEPWRVLARL
jgi:hypothetical protein